MSNKRITDLTELTTPTTDDVFPVVDIATNTTTKVQLGNLPVPSSVTTALATKQNTLVSGTNIKTVNSNSLLGSGDIAVQETLVSGTNIKTLNNTSLLGSGNITLTANPSGVSGAIQFSNGSAFASDAANLFWDDTNNRLGVGTNAPAQTLQVLAPNNSTITKLATAQNGIQIIDATTLYGVNAFGIYGANVTPSSTNYILHNVIDVYTRLNGGQIDLAVNGTSRLTVLSSGSVGIGTTSPSARTHIVGSGSTSATTSLLVQNSAGSELFKVSDNGDLVGSTFSSILSGSTYLTRLGSTNSRLEFLNSSSTAEIAGYYRAGGTFVPLDIYSSVLNLQPYGNSVNVGTQTSVASAVFNIQSTTKGFLPPRMTTTQKNAIASPAAGLIVYDSTTNKLCCYNGSTWNDLF